MEYCQATRTEPVEVEISSQSEDGPYRLCSAAADRLQKFSLRPREWYNLAVIHGPFEYYLHDDFYDEDGSACQSAEPVLDAASFPIPSLAEAAGDVQGALDFALTRWFLRDDVVAALQQLERREVLTALEARYQRTRNPLLRQRYVEICGRVLGRIAESWIRKCLAEAAIRDQVLVLYAAAGCLPQDEAMSIAIAALAELPPPQRVQYVSVLSQFRDPSVLEWIEQNVAEPLTGQWGDLAACSRISWPRLCKWLSHGRPLSLVALDAMVACKSPRPSQSLVMQRIAPKLTDHPGYEPIRTVLAKVVQRDPSPRVKSSVDYIVQNLPVICGDGASGVVA